MGSDIKICKRCGKMFRYVGEAHCTACVAELDVIFVKIRDYLDTHYNAGVKDIIKDTEVKERDVLAMLREGRFMLSTPDGTLKCSKCGKAITTGSICDACREKLSKTFQDFTQKAKAMEQAQVRKISDTRSRGMHVDR